MDITDNGAVTVYRTPGVYSSSGFQAIAQPVSEAPHSPSYHLPTADIGRLLATAAARNGISPALLNAVAWHESGYRGNAVSPKGAVGIMQLMSGTARDLGVNRYDLSQNIFGGAAYLKQMLVRYSNVPMALAAYNAGPGAVDHFHGIPPFNETRTYVQRILGGGAQPIHSIPQFVISIDR